MADIESGSLYMAAADWAAGAIGILINGPVADVITQVASDGTISNAKAIKLKKMGEKISAHVMELVIGYHDLLREEAEEAGIDVGPPADGKEALISVIENMVSPFGGGGR